MEGKEVNQHQQYDRRHWMQLSSMAFTAVCLPASLRAAGDKSAQYGYHLAQVQPLPFSMPDNKKIPFNWPVAEVPVNGSKVALNWDKKFRQKHKNIRFRLTSATDVREECTLEISMAQSGIKIGTLDMRYAHYMQPFEMTISAGLVQQLLDEGIYVKMIKGTKPLWFFIQAENNNEVPDAYLPHLLVADTLINTNAWKQRLLSFASLSTFGWMEGCVLDGLIMMAQHDKSARNVLQQHLAKYFANNTLVYANLNNVESAEKISTVESILPFAMLALQNPQHAMLQKAIDFCTAHADAKGVVADGSGTNRTLKTEECYTISYPLAVLAKMLNRPDLVKMSIATLVARVNLLMSDDFIFQRSNEAEKPVFGNWARGVGWYLLGLAKTLAVLPATEETAMLRTSFQKGADLAIRYQLSNGLWNCFLHQPETGIETSGSASIAAALAYGHSQQLLPAAYGEAAKKCSAGLKAYFTPDGFLTGTSQVNKGGEGLQRNGFRVISPYTLGFIAILDTAQGATYKR